MSLKVVGVDVTTTVAVVTASARDDTLEAIYLVNRFLKRRKRILGIKILHECFCCNLNHWTNLTNMFSVAFFDNFKLFIRVEAVIRVVVGHAAAVVALDSAR